MPDYESSDSDLDNDTKPKGLNIELHPALQAGNIKLVKSIYNDTRDSSKKNTNPYLYSIKKKAQKRKIIDIEEQDATDLNATGTLNEADIFERADFETMDHWDILFYNKDMSVKPKYLQDYENIKIEDDSEVEEIEQEQEDEEFDFPSVRFVQHPVPYSNVNENNERSIKFDSSLLTKQERIKLRRQNRKKKRMEVYQQIRNGEIKMPENKISIKKINNVLMNDKTIEDPTKFEIMVKQKIEERKKIHEEQNKKRKLEALDIKKKKQEESKKLKNEIVDQQNHHCKVFLIHNLSSPKIRFQINTTAKQLKLVGFSVRLRTDNQAGKGIIWIISDKLTNLNKFERKMFKFNNPDERDNRGFHIELKWEGPAVLDLKNMFFVEKKAWFMREFPNEEELLRELQKHGVAKYW
ncbi:hypothetical protein QEN19_001128 [Hanseniaspora menglaensis]